MNDTKRHNKIILISGPPASGKSSTATRIGTEFGLPVFSSDSLKEILFNRLGAPMHGTDERNRIGATSFELLYHIMGACVSSGTAAVFEAHFYPPWSETTLKEILSDTDTFYIHCSADRTVVERRFRERAASADRHPGHRDSELVQRKDFPELLFESDFRPDIDVPVHAIDTTDFDTVDFDSLMHEIDTFLDDTSTGN